MDSLCPWFVCYIPLVRGSQFQSQRHGNYARRVLVRVRVSLIHIVLDPLCHVPLHPIQYHKLVQHPSKRILIALGNNSIFFDTVVLRLFFSRVHWVAPTPLIKTESILIFLSDSCLPMLQVHAILATAGTDWICGAYLRHTTFTIFFSSDEGMERNV